jgi:hypothetical protein
MKQAGLSRQEIAECIEKGNFIKKEEEKPILKNASNRNTRREEI